MRLRKRESLSLINSHGYLENLLMKKWLLAARFKTLPAAISPIIVGSSLAYHDGAFYPITFFVILLTAILIQIGTNFSNDVYDFLNGSDREDRIGPKRLTQSGDISPIKMKRAMWTTFSVAVILGIYLVHYSFLSQLSFSPQEWQTIQKLLQYLIVE